MPVANILTLVPGKMTGQQIADFALEEDRARRRAEARGDHKSALQHDAEIDLLAKLFRNSK